ncbi:MAG TPA: alpha/beta hydrolase [Polyangiales bacterium]|nr:alpha/beta hydrolase [Polyangiales bacterium]
MSGKPRLSMQHAALLRSAGRAIARAAARRLRNGPTHPNWPWLYEFTAAFMRTAAIDFEPLAIAWARGQVSPTPITLRRKLRLDISEVAGVRVDRFRAPRARGDEPTVLYIHGGGYVTCSPASHRDSTARIAHVAGARVIAPYYRLAPEHPFPAALEDVLRVYRALLQQGTPPERLVIGGDSAGGGLALALMLRLREEGVTLPRAAFLISPWVDLSVTRELLENTAPHDYLGAEVTFENGRAYAGMEPLTNPLISPALADLAGLPPLLVQSGEWELLNEQHHRFVARARAAGVDVQLEQAPGMLHAYTCFAGVVPAGRAALASIGQFVRQQTASPVRTLNTGVELASADVA